MLNTQTVLITDGDERAALAIVRSLGAAGYRCIVGSASGWSIAGGSRYAFEEIELPSASSHPDGFAAAVAEIVAEMRIDVVLPVTEASILAILPGREQIPALLPYPDIEVFRAICDKEKVLSAAAELGIRVPEQRTLTSRTDTARFEIPFPVVLKPTRSVYTAADGSRGKVGVRWGHDAESLDAELSAFPSEAFPILLQEVIAGPGIGIFVLVSDGSVRASFAHRRIREKPPSGGVSVVRQSEPMDDRLLSCSVGLLDRFGWNGVAMVEYKIDARTGEAALMEINGRFWGSLQLAIDAGIDFPKLLLDATLSPSSAVPAYGFARSRWTWGDTDHLLARWKDSRSGLLERLAATAAWLRAFGPGYQDEMWRWTDPRPAIRETVTWFNSLRRKT